MKTIYLLRHAKANAGLNDLERDLSAKGRRQAEYIGQWMRENGIMPDRIISSPAKRTTATARLCAEQADYQGKIRFADDLYDAHSNTYIDLIAGLNNKHDSVMIVGHNPEISAMVTVLTGEPLTMSPGTLVCIEMTTDQWVAARDGNASLKWAHNMGTPWFIIWGHLTSYLLTSSAYNEIATSWQELREWWPLDIPIT